ncbi:uncharacterized protein CMU_034610 [Cryptosporidium muris RN66]|uniref:Transmembrane protein n=1 Tax=Cryptosporidium muris (strain RN66) TaxID=441375 RepID=B6AFT4_CRYMR|nr:uncharacterized protein CMU_034610 [Cryptosporidium muris RN66]EEA07075.1 hypothetical protein, conserved [Cryptosporidium muris RN66]|eukprot:XP_002141424.1 hypothetical protein [Cryptosporidium muris RN66]
MSPIRRRIRRSQLDIDAPFLFFQNSLTLGSCTDSSIPTQLLFPDSTIALGFHPSADSICPGLIDSDIDSSGGGHLEKPTVIISSESSELEIIRRDFLLWGSLYSISLVIALVSIILLIVNPNLSPLYNTLIHNAIQAKGVFYISCFLLSICPLLAVIYRIPLLMMLYKAAFPSSLLILCIFFLNHYIDLMFLIPLMLARISIAKIQYDMVS